MIFDKFKYLRSIISTIYFNFHYLPFRQAIHLPILLYKPHLLCCKGKISIEGGVFLGMIKLGFRKVSVYPNSGFTWEDKGGTTIFRGRCDIGNDCYLSFGPKTTVDFGDGFCMTAGGKIISYRGIKFGKGVSLGWEVLCMDTNIHPLFDIVNKVYKKASGPIIIGDYNWFGTQCKIMHSTITPERCVFGIGSIVTRGSEKKSYCVMGGSPLRIIAENVIRDYNHDYED